MKRAAFVLAAVGLVAAACASASAGTSVASGSAMPMAPSSAFAANPASGQWPEIIRKAPSEVQEAYRFGVANYATLHWIPCYCGCVAQGHRDNFDCYVSQITAGGWLILETHAVG